MHQLDTAGEPRLKKNRCVRDVRMWNSKMRDQTRQVVRRSEIIKSCVAWLAIPFFLYHHSCSLQLQQNKNILSATFVSDVIKEENILTFEGNG